MNAVDEYKKIKAFVEALEARRLRMFHRELNFIMGDPCCMEFAFITLDWTKWNSVTKFTLPPVRWGEKSQLNLQNVKLLLARKVHTIASFPSLFSYNCLSSKLPIYRLFSRSNPYGFTFFILLRFQHALFVALHITPFRILVKLTPLTPC